MLRRVLLTPLSIRPLHRGRPIPAECMNRAAPGTWSLPADGTAVSDDTRGPLGQTHVPPSPAREDGPRFADVSQPLIAIAGSPTRIRRWQAPSSPVGPSTAGGPRPMGTATGQDHHGSTTRRYRSPGRVSPPPGRVVLVPAGRAGRSGVAVLAPHLAQHGLPGRSPLLAGWPPGVGPLAPWGPHPGLPSVLFRCALPLPAGWRPGGQHRRPPWRALAVAVFHARSHQPVVGHDETALRTASRAPGCRAVRHLGRHRSSSALSRLTTRWRCSSLRSPPGWRVRSVDCAALARVLLLIISGITLAAADAVKYATALFHPRRGGHRGVRGVAPAWGCSRSTRGADCPLLVACGGHRGRRGWRA